MTFGRGNAQKKVAVPTHYRSSVPTQRLATVKRFDKPAGDHSTSALLTAGFGRLPFDGWLLAVTILLVALSILMVFSTTAPLALDSSGSSMSMVKRHTVGVIIGIFCLLVTMNLRPRILLAASRPLLVVTILLLGLVLIPSIGDLAGGARRWLAFGPLRVQPGEIAKLAFVLYMADYIGRHYEKMINFVPGALIPLILVGVADVLLLLEPDFGTSVIIALVVMFQLLTVGRFWHLGSIGLAGAAAMALLLWNSPYRLRRIQAFLDPEHDLSSAGYQLFQSLIAVGSGGMFGTGLGAGRQKLFYLPAAHTDFIYAVIAEELGFVGAIGVLILFLVIAWRGLRIALRLAEYPALCSLAVGCTLLLVLPALLNMGVVLGLLPTKGLVLPLVAYGGSAMMVNLAVVGILLQLSRLQP